MNWLFSYAGTLKICAFILFTLYHLSNGKPTGNSKLPANWRNLIGDDVYKYYTNKSRSKTVTNFFEGDVAGIDVEAMNVGNITASLAQNAIRDKDRLWPNGVVIYDMDGLFSSEERDVIVRALNDISSKTCITFKQRTSEESFILFGKSHSGCYSYIGRTGRSQDLNLLPGCITYFGEVQHEVMHALGFNHEQTRMDRDEYVTIIWDNISEDQRNNFEKYDGNPQGHPYDYNSIMHYGWNAFAIDSDSPTIIPSNGEKASIGNRKVMSPLDVRKINMLYGCSNIDDDDDETESETEIETTEAPNTEDWSLRAGCQSWWTIRKRDTCYFTAAICQISLTELYDRNPILENGDNCNNLFVGVQLCCSY